MNNNSNNIIIATDLDRTLFPNGNQPYDNSMEKFKDYVESHSVPLIFVTGRNLNQIKEGIKEYDPPMPLFLVAEVGTKVYKFENNTFTEEEGYISHIKKHTKNWSIDSFKEVLKNLSGLEVQEDFNQNEFKLSYYIKNLSKKNEIHDEVLKKVKSICSDINIIYSVDETKGLGLLDILPMRANKMEGIEYLRQKLNCNVEDIIYCGDSGNDIIPLTFGYRAVVVNNTIDSVKQEVLSIAKSKGIEKQIYIASGNEKFNGNYVSGILEGIDYFSERK